MEYFLDIASTQHMTKSARRLHVAQPALSRSLAKLEEELGVKLFRRTGKGLLLTEEGKLLQSRLIPIVHDIHQTESLFGDIRQGEHAEIRIRVNAGSRIAARALAQWMGENPQARLALAQHSPFEDNAHVVVSSRLPDDYVREECFTERVMIAAPASTKFKTDAVELAELAALSFVSLPSTAGFSRFAAEMCARERFQPHIALESDNPSVVREMIELGLGVGFWPEKSWGKLEGDAVVLHPLANGACRSVHVSLSPLGEANEKAVGLFECLCGFFRGIFSE